MRTFRATAINDRGWTFTFTFLATWFQIEAAAARVLERIVAADQLHKQHGPWTVKSVDVSA